MELTVYLVESHCGIFGLDSGVVLHSFFSSSYLLVQAFHYYYSQAKILAGTFMGDPERITTYWVLCWLVCLVILCLIALVLSVSGVIGVTRSL